MQPLDIDHKALETAAEILGNNGPIAMVNLLRYREVAAYGTAVAATPCSGKAAYYARYLPAFSAVPGAEQAKVVWIGNAHGVLVGARGEVWDDIAIVEYPSMKVFREIVEHPKYKSDADPHRAAALADWRFIVTTPAQLPG